MHFTSRQLSDMFSCLVGRNWLGTLDCVILLGSHWLAQRFFFFRHGGQPAARTTQLIGGARLRHCACVLLAG
jgi:hypothetical protein